MIPFTVCKLAQPGDAHPSLLPPHVQRPTPASGAPDDGQNSSLESSVRNCDLYTVSAEGGAAAPAAWAVVGFRLRAPSGWFGHSQTLATARETHR